jgi:hypothetical protein
VDGQAADDKKKAQQHALNAVLHRLTQLAVATMPVWMGRLQITGSRVQHNCEVNIGMQRCKHSFDGLQS